MPVASRGIPKWVTSLWTIRTPLSHTQVNGVSLQTALHDNGIQQFIPHFNMGRPYLSNFEVYHSKVWRFFINPHSAGSVLKVYGTVPPGNGSAILMDVTIDGSVSSIISVTSGSAAVYANLFYQSSAMESIWHTVVITNRGSAGNLDFEFDRVELDANDILPTVSSISITSTTAASGTSNSQLSAQSSK